MKKIIVGLMLVLFLADAAGAASSFSIPVSCSIPAVPGLNAPLAEKTEEQAAPVVTYENGEEILLAENTTATALTQTFYTR